MSIDIVTLFPSMFKGPFDESIVKRAVDKKLATIRIHNLRNWAIDKRGTVDDHPYGGGVGMLLRPEPVFSAVESIKNSVFSNQYSVKKKPITDNRKLRTDNRRLKTILLDAGGKLFNQQKAVEYSKLDRLILICGHYEGVDYRVHQYLADEVISIGDFVLTGGELPAMMITDSIIRLIPGVLTKKEAITIESFSSQHSRHPEHSDFRHPEFISGSIKGSSSEVRKFKVEKQPLLGGGLVVEFPQYTRPEVFNGHRVPKVLLSGHHKEIEKWRYTQSVKRTKKFRPDLMQTKP